MRSKLFGLLAFLLTAMPLPTAAAGTRILLMARDLEERPLPKLRFAWRGKESLPTTRTGATELDLIAQLSPGQQIKISLVAGSTQSEGWFLINSQVNIPSGTDPAEVVLMLRSAFRLMAAEVLDASCTAELSVEERKKVLVEAAARYGLTAEQLETALRSFAETQDLADQGVAAYLKGSYLQAESLLKSAAENKERDLVATLQYLGASQYEQIKSRAAADTFLKAVILGYENRDLLIWLSKTFSQWADLLQVTSHFAEAEPLMRRAVVIFQEFERRTGHEHSGEEIVSANYRWLLKKMGKTDDEVEALIQSVQ